MKGSINRYIIKLIKKLIWKKQTATMLKIVFSFKLSHYHSKEKLRNNNKKENKDIHPNLVGGWFMKNLNTSSKPL